MLTRFFRAIFISIFFVFLLFTGLSFAKTIGVYPPTNLKQNDSITAGLWFNNSNVTFWMNKPMDDGFIMGTGIGVDVFNIDNSQLVESYSQVRLDDNDYALVNLQFIDGKYRWQAKTFSIFSGDSSWVQFGSNLDADMDFGIDRVAPETTIEGGPLGFTGGTGSSGFVPRSVNDQYLVSARGNDGSGSGVTKFKYRISPWWTYPNWYEYESASLLNNPVFGGTFQLAPDDTYTIEYRAVDQAGNEDTSSATRTFTVDATPPETTSLIGLPAEGSVVNFFLNTVAWEGDDGNGSGVKEFQMQINNSGWITREEPYEWGPLADGNYTFQVRAVDNVGNIDPTPLTRNFTVDSIPPTGSITINNNAQYTNNPNVTIDLSQVTDTSGPKDMQFDNNDGNWSIPLELFAPTKSWLLSDGDGLKTVRAYILDKANNPATFQDSITLDTTPPPIPSITSPNSTVNSTSFNWTASTDTLSGLAGYEIERADDDNNSPNSSTWAPLASVDDATLSYTDNNLQSNTRYWYRLKAKDQVNNYSVFTTPFKIATRADAPKNGVLNAVSPSQIDISWGSGGRQDRYHVYEWNQGLICDPVITSCSHTGLSPNTRYNYNIYGVNLEGQEAGGIIGVNTVTLPKSPDISSNRIIGGSFSDSQDVEFTTNIPFGNGSLAYYNYIWDQQPTYVWGNSLPSTWQNSDGLKLTLPANARGSWYLHIRSMNSAGQPGEAKDLGPYNYNNQAPVADAGGPYNIIWGNNLSLNGSKSTDLDGDPLVFEWDLNNDNTFGEVAGEKPVINFAQQQAWFTGAGTHTIRLRVRDTFGLTHVGSTLVNIAANAPPQQINPTQPVQPMPLSNTSILLSAKPKVVKAGFWAKIAGKVKDTIGKALANVKVILKAKVQKPVKGKAKSAAKAKAKWVTLAILTTNAKGEFVYKHKPKQTTIYKAQFAGNTSFSASSSKEVKVIVKKVKKKKKK